MISPDIELVIFDADGTLRWVTVPGQHYPLTAEEWRLMPGVRETLARLDPSRLKFAIASNQHGVALGLLSRVQAEKMLRDTWQAAFSGNAPEVRIEMCICAPDSPCARRKPEPGMLLSTLRALKVAPERALYIGDLPIDQAAARAAGVHFSWAPAFFQF